MSEYVPRHSQRDVIQAYAGFFARNFLVADMAGAAGAISPLSRDVALLNHVTATIALAHEAYDMADGVSSDAEQAAACNAVFVSSLAEAKLRCRYDGPLPTGNFTPQQWEVMALGIKSRLRTTQSEPVVASPLQILQGLYTGTVRYAMESFAPATPGAA